MPLRISPADARRFARECFARVGMEPGDAELVADHLVTASLRGVDSHGIVRIPFYIDGIRRGLVKPSAPIFVILSIL